MTAEYQDKEVQCSDCPTKFVLKAEAQKFFAEKGLKQPKRCPPCRDKNRAKHEAKGVPQRPKEPRKHLREAPAPAPVRKISDRELLGDVPHSGVGPNGERQWSFGG